MKTSKKKPSRLIFLASIILFGFTVLPVIAQNNVEPSIIKDKEVQKAVDLYAKNDYPQAKSLLEGIIKKNDKNDEAHYVLAIVLSRMNNLDEAKDEAEKAIKLKTTNAEYHYALASILIIESRTASFFRLASIASSMKEELVTAQSLDPNHIKTMLALAIYYINAPGIMGGDNNKAIEQANLLIKLDEKQGRILLCQIFLSMKDYEKATEAANKLLKIDEKQARIFLVQIYSNLNNNSKAAEEIENLIKIDEYSGRFLLIQGLKKKGDLIKVEEQYKIIESKFGNNPDYFAFFNDYGYFLLGQKRVDEAIEKFKKQVQLAPQSANAHDSLGEGYFNKKMLEESLAEYTKALELNPDSKSAKDKIKEIKDLMND
jgi:Tfp pilus assembly protein PilF